MKTKIKVSQSHINNATPQDRMIRKPKHGETITIVEASPMDKHITALGETVHAISSLRDSICRDTENITTNEWVIICAMIESLRSNAKGIHELLLQKK